LKKTSFGKQGKKGKQGKVLNLDHLDFDIVSDFVLRISYFVSHGTSTTVESPLQISSFMQNKPNFPKSQINVTKVITRDNEDKTLGERGKNKPNTKPKQSQTNPIPEKHKMNVSYIITKGYENKPHFWVKAKQTQYKPKQTQFQRGNHHKKHEYRSRSRRSGPCKSGPWTDWTERRSGICLSKIRPLKVRPLDGLDGTESGPCKSGPWTDWTERRFGLPWTETNPILTPAQVNIIRCDLRLSQSENLSIIIEKVRLLLQNNGVPESKGRF